MPLRSPLLRPLAIALVKRLLPLSVRAPPLGRPVAAPSEAVPQQKGPPLGVGKAQRRHGDDEHGTQEAQRKTCQSEEEQHAAYMEVLLQRRTVCG